MPYFVCMSHIESSLLKSQCWCTQLKRLLWTHHVTVCVCSEIRWKDKMRGVTFILLSDVLIGLHIVLLLRQSLTWLTHGHGHCLSDTELEFGHLLFFKLFLKDYHWHCTAQHTPLIIAADPQYWCKQCRLSPPPSSLSLRHSIPPIKLQISFRTTTATSPLLCLGNSHTHIRPSLLKSQQWSKIGTTRGTATDPRNTLTRTPDRDAYGYPHSYKAVWGYLSSCYWRN